MLMLLDSILYAQVSGRELLVDWRDGKYGALGENAFGQLFEAPAAGDLSVVRGCESVTPAVWRGELETSVDELFAKHYPNDEEIDGVARVAEKYTVNVRGGGHPETVAVRWGWTHELPAWRSALAGALPEFRGKTDEAILRWVMRGRLVLSPELREKIAAFRAANMPGKSIGVHVRFSDRKNAYDVCFKHVQAFLREHPDAVVFLATDNQQVEKDFKSRFPRVAVSEKWFPPAGVPIHRNDLPERRPLDNAREALLDLYLLGSCDALVFNSTSTFSILAKLLSDAPPGWLIDTAPLLKPLMRKGLRGMRSMRDSIRFAIGLGRS
jgi:hypothetical protein